MQSSKDYYNSQNYGYNQSYSGGGGNGGYGGEAGRYAYPPSQPQGNNYYGGGAYQGNDSVLLTRTLGNVWLSNFYNIFLY